MLRVVIVGCRFTISAQRIAAYLVQACSVVFCRPASATVEIGLATGLEAGLDMTGSVDCAAAG